MDFYSIMQWIYPLLDLIIMVLCFTMLRNTGGILLGVAFLIMAVSSLSWPLTEWLMSLKPGNNYLYEISSIAGFVAYFISSLLIIFGVISLSSSVRTGDSP